MFSYYGSKSKIAHLYPAPLYGRIVEPFAGSARYSLLHFENDVCLYDASSVVVAIWRYLIAASERDILSLPDVPSKVSLDTFKQLSSVERSLIGFHLCRGKAKPRKVGHGQNSWNQDKKRIASNLHKIRHWKVALGSFENRPRNPLATWFIDPPYRFNQTRPENTDRYPHGSINYDDLAAFIRSRRGLVIACEGDDHGDYLPFELLTRVNANTNNRAVKKTGEFFYVRHSAEI